MSACRWRAERSSQSARVAQTRCAAPMPSHIIILQTTSSLRRTCGAGSATVCGAVAAGCQAGRLGGGCARVSGGKPMLNLIFAVVAATAQPAATAPQTVAEPAPHVRRSEEVVCKMMMWDGIGARSTDALCRADAVPHHHLANHLFTATHMRRRFSDSLWRCRGRLRGRCDHREDQVQHGLASRNAGASSSQPPGLATGR